MKWFLIENLFIIVLGLLLLATKSEETSFWLLKVLVEKILPDYYTKTMDGLIVDIEVLSELVKTKVPDVHQHVINLGKHHYYLFCNCFKRLHLLSKLTTDW